jgi:ABC-type multidrug transport system fused ATPase/permease subunit
MKLQLASLALILATAFPLGILAASRRGLWPDHLVRFIAAFGQAAPSFWVGLLLMALFSAARFYFVSKIGERVVADLRADVYDHILSLSSGYFARVRTGEVLSRLTVDAALVENLVGSTASIATRATLAMALVGVALVPLFENAKSIINLLQQLNGLTSMPILSAFIVGLLFKGVHAEAASLAILFGVAFYGWLSFAPPGFLPAGFHYIDAMLVTLVACVAVALASNRLMRMRG